MARVRLVPSTYDVSNSTYLSVNNVSNMYTDTDSTTYGYVQHTRSATTAYYFYLGGFDFSVIPSGATINSFSIKLKGFESDASTSSTYAPWVSTEMDYRTGTSLGTFSVLSTSVQTLTATMTGTWDDLTSGLLGSPAIIIPCRRNARGTVAYYYIYGAEIYVDYTEAASDAIYFKDGSTWTEASAVYKKVSGIWTLQSDLTSVFDSNTNYIKGSS